MADFQDVVDAINNLGTQLGGRNQGGQPDSPEEIQRRFDALDAENEALERQRALIEKRSDSADRDQALRDNEIQQSKLAQQRLEALTAAYKANGEAQSEQAKAAQEALDAIREQTDELEEQEEQLQQNTKATEDLKQATDGITQSVQSSMMAYEKHSVVNTTTIKNMYQSVKAAGAVGTTLGVLKGGILAAVDSMLSLAMSFDVATSEMMRNTGATREQAQAIAADVQLMASLGVEVKELTAAHTALRGTMTDFTMLSMDQQREVANTGALLAEQGGSLEDYARGMQTSTKAFGMSAAESAAAARDLNSLAVEIGVIPSQMGADFANASDQLAKFGSGGVKAFKDLAIVSKSTGLSIDKLLKITEKFDTFEGAAEQAGMLNAALGGNFVNAMDLMTTTDPTERFKMIQDAIKNTGLSFDDMSYYQRKFYAEAAGLDDVNDLALLMSGNFDSLAGAQQMSSDEILRLQKRTEEFQSVQEKFKNLLQSMIPVLTPLINKLHEWFKTITSNRQTMAKIAAFFEGLGDIIIFVAENFKTFLKVGLILFGVKLLAGIIKFGVGMAAAGKGAAAGGQGMMAGSVGMIAFGAAVWMVGEGVEAAATGIAALAEAFKGIDDRALAATAVTMVALAGGIYALGTAGLSAGLGLIKLGVGVVIIGAGIKLATEGIGAMAEGFALLFANASPAQLESFAIVLGAFAVSAIALGMAGPIAFIGMGALATGFIALGAAMMMMEGSLTAFANFTGHLSALASNSSGLKEVSSEIIAIANAINTLPLFPTMALSTAFEAAKANVTTTVAATAAAAPAAAAAQQKPPKVEVKVYIDDVETSPRKIETTLNGILEQYLT